MHILRRSRCANCARRVWTPLRASQTGVGLSPALITASPALSEYEAGKYHGGLRPPSVLPVQRSAKSAAAAAAAAAAAVWRSTQKPMPTLREPLRFAGHVTGRFIGATSSGANGGLLWTHGRELVKSGSLSPPGMVLILPGISAQNGARRSPTYCTHTQHNALHQSYFS
jgi:hypothetical protein